MKKNKNPPRRGKRDEGVTPVTIKGGGGGSVTMLWQSGSGGEGCCIGGEKRFLQACFRLR